MVVRTISNNIVLKTFSSMLLFAIRAISESPRQSCLLSLKKSKM